MAARYSQGTVRGVEEGQFNAEEAAKTLRQAVRGLGTDEDSIIQVLSDHNNQQRQQIKHIYKTAFGRDLVEDLKDDLGGNFLRLCGYLLLPQAHFDARCLAYALPDCKWEMVIDVLATRDNLQLEGIRTSYEDLQGQVLDEAINRWAAGDLQRVLTAVAQGGRSDAMAVEQDRVDRDVQDLFEAGIGKMLGTDEDVFTRILVSRSASHLQAVFQAYEDKHHHTVEQAIDGEMSGATQRAYRAIVRCLRDPVSHFAQCFHEAFKGPGTDDERLMQLIVSHSEIDLQDISDKYYEIYGCTLYAAINDETSGDYRKLLLKILDQGEKPATHKTKDASK